MKLNLKRGLKKNKNLIIFFLSLIIMVNCSAQESNFLNSQTYKKEKSGNDSLRFELESLKYDSVKMFYFNKEKYNVNEFSLKVDTPNIYNRITFPDTSFVSIDGSQTDHKGALVFMHDAKKLLKILANFKNEVFPYNEPIKEYIPTVGFVFFKNKVAVGHIDIAFFDNKIRIEIFKNNSLNYHYSRDVIGSKLEDFCRKLAHRNHFPSWVFSRRISRWEK
ncbi:hypothetical protein [Mucilaginibacter aquariorum]|uniref:Lipoprotein n=1 Tax=Mucilaginibacter aquariorum TaxID=2967225 RepID=A0ABT1SZ90_9SPHI|nr:hypothetical protein [Mucilaginibacter aquariorum]MCQ6957538.1 hypothetical protein [Mucilaginibacter aquariorum]